MTDPCTSGRYPYTHCSDFIREHGPQNGAPPILSRADAARLKSKIAGALGMDEKDLAEKLADAFLAERQEA